MNRKAVVSIRKACDLGGLELEPPQYLKGDCHGRREEDQQHERRILAASPREPEPACDVMR